MTWWYSRDPKNSYLVPFPQAAVGGESGKSKRYEFLAPRISLHPVLTTSLKLREARAAGATLAGLCSCHLQLPASWVSDLGLGPYSRW